MSRNDFHENNAFGVKTYRHLLNIFYHDYCDDGRFVSIGDITRSRISDILQRELKTDTIIQKGDFVKGRCYTVATHQRPLNVASGRFNLQTPLHF